MPDADRGGGRGHRCAAGYGGAVAAAILRRHPSLDLVAVTARSDAGRRHDELYPRYRVPLVLEELDPDSIAERARAAVVAYPHGAAAPAVKALRERGLKVVDLSADFRLDRDRYERWYQPHEAPELLDDAVYGLTEAHRDEIRGADLVAAPGCYPTAALLALWPLREHISRRGRRRQVGRLRRRPRRHPDHPLRLGHRERAGLQDRGPPPRAPSSSRS